MPGSPGASVAPPALVVVLFMMMYISLPRPLRSLALRGLNYFIPAEE